METLRLREWRTTYALVLTPNQRDALREDFKATVQPTAGSSDTYDVTPGNIVGAALVGDKVLLIEPKIPIARVLFLLAYAADPSAWKDDPSAIGDAPDVLAGVAELHAKLCERALRRGLLAGYHVVDDQLHTVRGRIDLAEQLRRRPGLDLPLAVSYQEHDEDTTENQLLLAATQLLRRLPIRSSHTRRTLHRLAEAFQNVTPVMFTPSAVPLVIWTRLNAHYRAAVELSRLLLRIRAVDIAPGTSETTVFTIDMASLFEEFVRTALREALSATSSQFPDGSGAPNIALDNRGRVRLKPDLSYWPQGSCTFIGDVKYKQDTGQGHNDDLYQLLAYATSVHLPSASLIYAEGPLDHMTHDVTGTAIQLFVRHLDLRQAPSQLLAQLRLIADEVRSPQAKTNRHAAV